MKDLTRNQEIGNTHHWVLSNIWRLQWIRDTKLGMSVSNGKLLNAAKYQVYSFYRFWVLRGNQQGKGLQFFPFPQIRVKQKTTTSPIGIYHFATYTWNNAFEVVTLNYIFIYGTKSSRMYHVKFAEDSL